MGLAQHDVPPKKLWVKNKSNDFYRFFRSFETFLSWTIPTLRSGQRRSYKAASTQERCELASLSYTESGIKSLMMQRSHLWYCRLHRWQTTWFRWHVGQCRDIWRWTPQYVQFEFCEALEGKVDWVLQRSCGRRHLPCILRHGYHAGAVQQCFFCAQRAGTSPSAKEVVVQRIQDHCEDWHTKKDRNYPQILAGTMWSNWTLSLGTILATWFPFRINATGVLAALPFTVPTFCTTCEGARGLLNALCWWVCPEPRPVILNHPISPPCHVMLHSLQKSLQKVRAKFIHLRKFPDHW